MRSAPLGFVAIVMVACGGSPNPRPDPMTGTAQQDSDLVGSWRLQTLPRSRERLAIDLRVDSLVLDSVFGRLTHFLQGDAGFYTPDEWGPLVGIVRQDTVELRVLAGDQTPPLAFRGVLRSDTVYLEDLQIASETRLGTWILIRLRPGG